MSEDEKIFFLQLIKKTVDRRLSHGSDTENDLETYHINTSKMFAKNLQNILKDDARKRSLLQKKTRQKKKTSFQQTPQKITEKP